MMGIRAAAIAACLLTGIVASSANAAPLGLTLEDSPRVSSRLIGVSYNASTDAFLAGGFTWRPPDGGSRIPILNHDIGRFNISATIDEFGIASAGDLSITAGHRGAGPTLLAATLTDFGFLDDGGDLFEFLFTVNDGAMGIPELFGGTGSVIGVVLDANGSNFGGDFTADFTNLFGRPSHGPRRDNDDDDDGHGLGLGLGLGHGHGHGLGMARTAPMPEPATLLLILTGALAWRFRQRA